MNTDDAPHLLDDGTAINMRNIRLNNTDDGRAGYMENIQGQLLLPEQEDIPEGSETVGVYEDPMGKFIIWFSHVPDTWKYDRINYYDLLEKRYWLIAKADIYDNGGEISGGFRFRTGVYYGMQVVGSLLIWTASGMEPMKIDIGAAIKESNPNVSTAEIPFYKGWQYDWTADDNSIDNLKLICKPPGIPPTVTRFFDETVSGNRISDESFQFATRFLYHTGEESVLSPFSLSSKLNTGFDDNINAIAVQLNPLERPFPQGLKAIRLYVKPESTQKVFAIHTWEMQQFVDNDTFVYQFYGDFIGEALDDAAATEPYHVVPLSAGAIAFAKNRLFLSDIVSGYDMPNRVNFSLFLTTRSITPSSGNAVREVSFFHSRGTWKKTGISRPRYYFSGLFVRLKAGEQHGGSVEGYYLIPDTDIVHKSDFVGVPPVFRASPASAGLNSLVYMGKTLRDVRDAFALREEMQLAKIYGENMLASAKLPFEGLTMIEILGLSSEDPSSRPPDGAFLHHADYRAGIVFYDRFLRKCGVVSPDTAIVSTPIRTYSPTEISDSIAWSLDTSVAAQRSEIPEWAHYYAPVLARNSRALWFVSGYAYGVRYAVMDEHGNFKADDGSDTSESSADDPFRVFNRYTVGVAVDGSSLVTAGAGYSYSQGDMCILIFKDSATGDTQTHILPVLGLAGRYIVLGKVKLKPVLVASDEAVYEIYTPNRAAEQDFYYETGQMHKVDSPGSATRRYTITGGAFRPDVYVKERVNQASFKAYAMSGNDNLWKRWITDFGRINAVTKLGRAAKPNTLSYSDVFTEGAAVNGVSAFHPLNEVSLPLEIGSVRKLQLTSKAQREGTVLLAIGRAIVVSVYLGETELVSADGDAFVAQTRNVVGNMNVLKGAYGTEHPESVKEFNGGVYWFDFIRNSFVKYDANGLFPFSDYKFKRGATLFSKNISALKASGRGVIVIGGIDPKYKEYIVQRRPVAAERNFYCKGIQSIQLEKDGTAEFPNRVRITHSFEQEALSFEWEYFNSDGMLFSRGNVFNAVSPYISFIEEPLMSDANTVNFRYRARSACGGGNFSDWADHSLKFTTDVPVPQPGDPTPQPPVQPCVGLGWPNNEKPTVLPSTSWYGTSYDASIFFTGSTPVTIDNMHGKPSWLNITVIGNQIRFQSDFVDFFGGTTFFIWFDVHNCGEKILEVDLALSTPVPDL
jgi:hypothetical protein